MASLMETLIQVLDEESQEYEKLLGLSMKKTPVLVSGDLDEYLIRDLKLQVFQILIVEGLFDPKQLEFGLSKLPRKQVQLDFSRSLSGFQLSAFAPGGQLLSGLFP